MSTNYTLQILNGTNSPGLAIESKLTLVRYGFTTTRYGNASTKDIQTTTLYPRNNLIITKFPNALKEIINFSTNENLPEAYTVEPYLSDTDYILELGNDFIETLNKLN
jgi:hypothetical protein